MTGRASSPASSPRVRAPRGTFVVLEGLDGAGTTTQARLLAERLRVRGRQVLVTAEPSNGPLGVLIRQVLSGRVVGRHGAGFDAGALALLFAADRLDHAAAEIGPALERGWDVVSDRFTLSSLAYQSLTCGAPAWIEAMNSRAPAPDVTLFLEVPARVAIGRRFAASGDRELFEVPDFQRRVARSYRRAIERLRRAGQQVEVVDGQGTVEQVTAALTARLEPYLRERAGVRGRGRRATRSTA